MACAGARGGGRRRGICRHRGRAAARPRRARVALLRAGAERSKSATKVSNHRGRRKESRNAGRGGPRRRLGLTTGFLGRGRPGPLRRQLASQMQGGNPRRSSRERPVTFPTREE